MNYSKTEKDKKCPPLSVILNLRNTQFSTVLATAALKLDWQSAVTKQEAKNTKVWDVMWTDSTTGIEKILARLKSFQKINHFPSAYLLHNKSHLARSMFKLQRISIESDFVPKTWQLPFDYQSILRYLKEGSNKSIEKCLIVKPFQVIIFI